MGMLSFKKCNHHACFITDYTTRSFQNSFNFSNYLDYLKTLSKSQSLESLSLFADNAEYNSWIFAFFPISENNENYLLFQDIFSSARAAQIPRGSTGAISKYFFPQSSSQVFFSH